MRGGVQQSAGQPQVKAHVTAVCKTVGSALAQPLVSVPSRTPYELRWASRPARIAAALRRAGGAGDLKDLAVQPDDLSLAESCATALARRHRTDSLGRVEVTDRDDMPLGLHDPHAEARRADAGPDPSAAAVVQRHAGRGG